MAAGLLLGVVLYASRGWAEPRKEPERRPNIVLVLADDLGYGELGCYGQRQILTPNTDRLAREGVRFTQFYAGSTVCAPSRCSLLTGRHTGTCRLRGNNSGLALLPEDVTLAETLKGAGYATGAIGKWGLGLTGSTGEPNRQGFDYSFGFLSQRKAHNYYPPRLRRNGALVPVPGNEGGRKGTYVQDLFTAEALGFIERHRQGPFFLYLAYTIPHANNELARDTGNGMEVPDDAPYSDRGWPAPQRNQAAMITRLDADLGKLRAKLEQLGIGDDTVLLFTSDNGPTEAGGARSAFFRSSGPLRGAKRDLYEGGIRVPLLVRWPARVPAGVVSDHVWAAWDLLPTLAGLAGARSPPGIDGLPMTAALIGKPQAGHEYLYWEFHERGFSQAVLMGRWKAVRRGSVKSPIELYDLGSDPGERRDVAGDHPDVIKEIRRILREARTPDRSWPRR